MLLQEVVRVVALLPKFVHLLDGHSEDEDILGADLLADLDIGTVEGADRQRAVEREFHVAGAGGLLAGGGDLLGEISRRDDLLGERDAVIRQEDNLESILHARIGVDLGPDGVNRLDDVLGEVVAGSGLGGKDENTRGDVVVGILKDPPIESQDVKEIEVLALVFVQALDLHIEEGGGIHNYATLLLDDAGEVDLIGMFDLHELALELRILCQGLQGMQFVEITLPTASDSGGDESCQTRIAGKKPAAWRDPVGLVVELAGVEFVELGEEIALEELGMERRDTVDRVTADHGQIRHTDHLVVPLLDQGELLDLIQIAWPNLLHLDEKAFVSLEDDLEMTGQNLAEEPHAPFFERFGQEGVVRVGQRPGDDRPGLLPGEAVHVMKKSLQLDHGDGWMGVVELDGDFLGKSLPVTVVLAEATDDVLERAGDEEVLLDQAEFLAALGLIVRIKDLGDSLADVLVTDGLVVTTSVEGLEIEILGRFGGPETQEIDGIGPITRNGNVVGDTDELFRAGPRGDIVADIVEDVLNLAVKIDLGGMLRAHNLPGSAELHPVVRQLDLITVSKFLFEETVLVMDPVSDGREVKGRERIEEAGSKAAKATVAKTHVIFLLTKLVDIKTEFTDRRPHVFHDAGAVKTVHVETPHQELEGEIVESLDVFLAVLGLSGHETLHQETVDGLGGSQPPIALGGCPGIPRQSEAELLHDEGFDSLDGGVEGRMESTFCGHD